MMVNGDVGIAGVGAERPQWQSSGRQEPHAEGGRQVRGRARESSPRASFSTYSFVPRGAQQPRYRVKPLAAQALVSPLYKTRLCSFYSAGACRAGPLCGFAHGELDLRPAPDFERTSVCPVLLKDGACRRYGCRYAHKSSELRVSPVMLKTKLCSFHFEHGGCVVGDACRFAHSHQELREASEVQEEVFARGAKIGVDPSILENKGRAAAMAAASRGQKRIQGLRTFLCGDHEASRDASVAHFSHTMASSQQVDLAFRTFAQAKQTASRLEEEWDASIEADEGHDHHRRRVVDIGQQQRQRQQRQQQEREEQDDQEEQGKQDEQEQQQQLVLQYLLQEPSRVTAKNRGPPCKGMTHAETQQRPLDQEVADSSGHVVLVEKFDAEKEFDIWQGRKNVRDNITQEARVFRRASDPSIVVSGGSSLEDNVDCSSQLDDQGQAVGHGCRDACSKGASCNEGRLSDILVDLGLKLVMKNTFLTTPDELAFPVEEQAVRRARRMRSQSL